MKAISRLKFKAIKFVITQRKRPLTLPECTTAENQQGDRNWLNLKG